MNQEREPDPRTGHLVEAKPPPCLAFNETMMHGRMVSKIETLASEQETDHENRGAHDRNAQIAYNLPCMGFN